MVEYSTLINNKTILLFPTLCLVGFLICLAITPSATGYENSIYQPYPFITWIFLGLLYLCPFLYLILAANNINGLQFHKKHINYILLISLIGTLLLLSLPLIRGYYSYTGGDVLTHMGTIYDILAGNTPAVINHYPATMILIAMINLVSGSTTADIILCSAQWTYGIFVLGMFILARRFCENYYQVAAVTGLSIIPMLGNILTQEIMMPSTIGWALLPLLFYCVYCVVTKAKGSRFFLITGCLIAIGEWFIHSEAVLFGAATLMLIFLFLRFAPIQREKLRNLDSIGLLIILGVMVAGAIYQITFTSIFSGQVTTYFSVLFGMESSAYLKSPIEVLASNASLLRKMIIMFSQYGQLIISGLVTLTIILIYILKNKIKTWDKKYVLLGILFIGIGLLVGLYLISGIDIGQGIYRMYKYVLIIVIFIMGVWFSNKLFSPQISLRNVAVTMGMIMLVTLTIIPLGNIYMAPEITGQTNFQVTEADMGGMKIFYETQNTDYAITETLTRVHVTRYASSIYGVMYKATIPNIRSKSTTYAMPENIIINNYMTVNEVFDKNTYYLYYPPNILFQRLLFPDLEMKGIASESLTHLNTDDSVSLIVDLGDDFKLYLIQK